MHSLCSFFSFDVNLNLLNFMYHLVARKGGKVTKNSGGTGLTSTEIFYLIYAS